MDQRIAVDAFERRRHAQRGLAVGAEKGGAFHDQERPQPLAAIEHAVPHRRHQPFRPGDLAGLGWVVEQARSSASTSRAANSRAVSKAIASARVMKRPFTANAVPVKPARAAAVQTLRIRPSAIMPKVSREEGLRGADRRTRNRRAGNGGEAKDARRGAWPAGWPRRGVQVAVVLRLLPPVLTLLYYPSFVHPVSTLMLKDLVTFPGYDRRWVALDDIAPVLAHSVIMSEDGQFCSHRGIDLAELKLVIDDAHGRRAGARRLDHHHADGEEPLSSGIGRSSRAQDRRSCRWRSISTWCCRKGGSWKSISTSPNGVRTSTASKRRRSIISAARRRT